MRRLHTGLLRLRHRRFVRLGADCRIERPVRQAHMTPQDRITIGARTVIDHDADITGQVSIGDDVRIERSAYIRPNVTIGDRVSIGPFVRLISDWHILGGPEWRKGPATYEPINVGEGAVIGAGATVLARVTIGAGAHVVDGSLVTKDVPPGATVAGVPARVVDDVDER
jgi:acetyltransferase-like isoleucine patch superfamily enzyme